MALPDAALVANGVLHASATGTVDVGSGNGQVASFGLARLLLVPVTAFSLDVRSALGFGDQLDVSAVAGDTNITSVTIDVVPFVNDINGIPSSLRLRLDISADALLTVLLNARHTEGR